MKHQLLVLLIIVRILRTIRLSIHAKKCDSFNIDTSIVLERACHAELAILILEVDLRYGVLHNGDTIVKVQRSLGIAIKTGSDNNVEALGPERSGGVCTLDTLGVDDTTLVVDCDLGEVNLSGDVLALAANGLASAPLVEDIVGELVFDARAVFFGHGAHEDAVAEEELQVDGVGVGVFGVVEEQRVQSWQAGLVLLVESSVKVV